MEGGFVLVCVFGIAEGASASDFQQQAIMPVYRINYLHGLFGYQSGLMKMPSTIYGKHHKCIS